MSNVVALRPEPEPDHAPERCAAAQCSHATVSRDGARRFPCRCETCDAETAAWVARTHAEQAIRRVAALSEIAPRFKTRTFATFVPEPRHERALAAAREVVDDPRLGLGLSGPNRVGKSHLAAAIVNACIARNVPACFIAIDDLLTTIRATYDAASRDYTENAMLRRYATVPVLVLDDLGKERLTDWAVSTMFTLTNRRFEQSLPLIVTSNRSPVDLAKREVAQGADLLTHTSTQHRIMEMVGEGRWISVAGRAAR